MGPCSQCNCALLAVADYEADQGTLTRLEGEEASVAGEGLQDEGRDATTCVLSSLGGAGSSLDLKGKNWLGLTQGLACFMRAHVCDRECLLQLPQADLGSLDPRKRVE